MRKDTTSGLAARPAHTGSVARPYRLLRLTKLDLSWKAQPVEPGT